MVTMVAEVVVVAVAGVAVAGEVIVAEAVAVVTREVVFPGQSWPKYHNLPNTKISGHTCDHR